MIPKLRNISHNPTEKINKNHTHNGRKIPKIIKLIIKSEKHACFHRFSEHQGTLNTDASESLLGGEEARAFGKKNNSTRSPLFSPELHSKTTAFTFLSVQLFFSSASVKKKHHHFTAQHEDRREQGAVEESGDSGMILPIRERIERGGWERGKRGQGRRLRLDTPYDDVVDPGQRTE